MRSVLLAQLRHHPGRYLATALATVIGTAFVALGFLFTSTLRDTLGNGLVAPVARADVVVGPRGALGIPSVTARQAQAAVGTPGVAASLTLRTGHGEADLPRVGRTEVTTETVATDPRLRSQRVAAGRAPRGDRELAVDTVTADATGLVPGNRVTIQDPTTLQDRRFTVVGVLDARGDLTATGRGFVLYYPDGHPVGQLDQGADAVALLTAPGTTPALLRAAVQRRLDGAGLAAGTNSAPDGQPVLASTLAQYRAATLAGVRTVADLLGGLVLAFAVLALAVAGLVIANTFVILLTQRTRELALLRCIGAERAQVFRSVVAEAAVLGAAAGVLGVALAAGVAAGGVAAANTFRLPLLIATPVLTWPAVAVPLAAGLLVTVVAALAPARRATAVAPVAALRQDLGLAVGNRRGLLRLGLGLTLVGAGAAVLAAGSAASGPQAVLMAAGGAVLTFVGLVAAARLWVPPVARLVGVVVRRTGGVPGRIGVLNVLRNPQRATATTTALVIGVTLVATVGVAAASGRASALGYVLAENPVDVTVGGTAPYFLEQQVPNLPDTTAPTPLPAGTAARVAAVRGLDAVVTLRAAAVGLERVGGGAPGSAVTATGVILAPTDGASHVVREGVADGLDDTTILLGTGAYVGDSSWPHGSRVRVVGPAGSRILTVRHESSLPTSALVSSATLTAVAGRTAVDAAVWARTAALDPGGDLDRIVDTVTAVRSAVGITASAAPGTPAPDGSALAVGGGGAAAATLVRVLDGLVRILTALLAVAVAIALVGIANTLSLSVLERRRENGLLRALGLGRGALRASILWEAVTLAVVAVVVGVGLGVAYGWLGTRAVFSGATAGRIPAQFVVPAGQLALLVGVTVAAGILASVLPARRAARTEPVQALAED